MKDRYVEKTLAEQVAVKLKKMIQNGEIEPNKIISQRSLSKELEVGITPLREAILQLSIEGYLVKIPYLGVMVSDVSDKDVRDIYSVRRVIEGYATRVACDRFSSRDRDILEDLVKVMKRADESDDNELYQKANEEFHMKIYNMSGNKFLIEIIRTLWKHFPRDTFKLMPERRTKSILNHISILKALEHNDPDAAGSLMAVHIAEAQYDIENFTLGRKNKSN
jgi:DNA-binding GntR family transcriptional regulator